MPKTNQNMKVTIQNADGADNGDGGEATAKLPTSKSATGVRAPSPPDDTEMMDRNRRSRKPQLKRTFAMILLPINIVYSIALISFYCSFLLFVNFHFYAKYFPKENKVVASFVVIFIVLSIVDVIMSASFYKMVENDANQDKLPKKALHWWIWSGFFMLYLFGHVAVPLGLMFYDNQFEKFYEFQLVQIGAFFGAHYLAARAISYYVILHCYLRKRFVPFLLEMVKRSGLTRIISVLDMIYHATWVIILIYQILDAILVLFTNQLARRWPTSHPTWSIFGAHNVWMYWFKMMAGIVILPVTAFALWSAKSLWACVDKLHKPKKALARINMWIYAAIAMTVISPITIVICCLDFYEGMVYFGTFVASGFLIPCRIGCIYLVFQFQLSVRKAWESNSIPLEEQEVER